MAHSPIFLVPLTLCLAGLVPAERLSAQEQLPSLPWPDYRGPTHDGQAGAARLPVAWSEAKNVTYKVRVPGKGWSTPVIGEGRVWMTTASRSGRKMSVLAFDLATGAKLLEKPVFEVRKPSPTHKLNSYASPSPVLEAGRVYVHFGTYGTACLDTVSHEVLWKRDDIKCQHIAGPGSSPVLFRDLLIFNVDGGDVQFVTALDKRTGKTRWRTERSIEWGETSPDMRKAFSTPLIFDYGGSARLISTGAKAAMVYDPQTGEEMWKVRYGRGFSMSVRPLYADGVLYLNTGFMRPQILAVKASGKGDVTSENILWKQSRSMPTMPSPVLVEKRIYQVSDSGIVTCIDIDSGKLKWRKRIGGEFSASPIVASGRIYFFDREGKTTVLRPGDKFDEVAVNELKNGCMASPAVVGDALVLRTRSHLYRIEQ